MKERGIKRGQRKENNRMKRRCTLTCHFFLDLPLTLYPSLPSPAPIFSLHSNFSLYPRILLEEIKELTGSERKNRERETGIRCTWFLSLFFPSGFCRNDRRERIEEKTGLFYLPHLCNMTLGKRFAYLRPED